ncbi:LysR family transcriptional regulator [[Ruminococcus] gnavus]|uniref:helix-turn-helix domain-containing protein n=1 Tax=Mediterraneibacter gnavus TaxID=33038 RepID=UPI00156FC099|nr:LysR family transcriptional regulator [Mediterraneibacter gnavus]NSH72573.1 LysR family transcriptional regulator [Mediterraneibacter gnavus]
MSQPSLSHAIAQLEKELGIPLFEKKRKKYNPDTIRRRISLLCGTHAVYSG